MSEAARRLAVVNGGAPSTPARPARALLPRARHRLLLAWLLYEDANERALQDYDERTACADESACA